MLLFSALVGICSVMLPVPLGAAKAIFVSLINVDEQTRKGMHGHMNGWMDGWMTGHMDGWVDGLVNKQMYTEIRGGKHEVLGHRG